MKQLSLAAAIAAASSLSSAGPLAPIIEPLAEGLAGTPLDAIIAPLNEIDSQLSALDGGGDNPLQPILDQLQGGGSGGDRGVPDVGVMDAMIADPMDGGAVGDFGPDGPPPRSCDELSAVIREAAAGEQTCVLDNQCVVIGGPQGCACGPVIGERTGVVVHFNTARAALLAYGELLGRCAGEGARVCEVQPSTASCDDRGDCVLEPGAACVPDGGVGEDPDLGPPGPSCEQLRAELLATVAAEGRCETPDDCALVGGSSSCQCNQHVGPPGGYGIRRDSAARAQQLVELIRSEGCADRESCGEAPAIERDPDCVGGTCRAGPAPPCDP